MARNAGVAGDPEDGPAKTVFAVALLRRGAAVVATKAVVATLVEKSPVVGVGAVGVPVKAGEAKGA